MCIRDSLKAVPGHEDLYRLRMQLEHRAANTAAIHATFNEPVSYTHLRAHETVLDLVCRLLLEKKKQPLQHIIITQYYKKRQNSSWNNSTQDT